MDEIINYVNNSPENTNPNVLRGMLGNMNTSQNESGGGSSGGVFVINFFWGEDVHYECSKTMSEINEAENAGSTIIATINDSILAINSTYTVNDLSEVVRADFDFWQPHWEIENAFFYRKLSMTAEGITETLTTYQLTPYTE